MAGTATAGIAHAALAADRLGAPMAYVRSAPKDHGRGNQIEGRIPAHSKVIMVEDLISTGGSVLKAAQAVEREGSTVVGVLALFSYELEKGHRAFEKAGVPLYTLSNYPTLIEVAAESGRITSEQQATLATWSSDPQAGRTRTDEPAGVLDPLTESRLRVANPRDLVGESAWIPGAGAGQALAIDDVQRVPALALKAATKR